MVSDVVDVVDSVRDNVMEAVDRSAPMLAPLLGREQRSSGRLKLVLVLVALVAAALMVRRRRQGAGRLNVPTPAGMSADLIEESRPTTR